MTAKCNRHKVKWGSFYKGGVGESTPLVLREGGKQSLSTEGGVGGRVLSLREGWETDYYYAGRVGGCCNSKRFWLIELLLDHTNYFDRFFDWLLLKIARLRSLTVEFRVWLLSRPVHHQLLYVSLCLFSISWLNLSIFLLQLTLLDKIMEFFSP